MFGVILGIKNKLLKIKESLLKSKYQIKRDGLIRNLKWLTVIPIEYPLSEKLRLDKHNTFI